MSTVKLISKGDEKYMVNLKNSNGNSGVRGYLTANEYIIVEFNDGSSYKYSYASAGITDIEEMKRLVIQGSGLNSFIMRNIRTFYEAKSN